MTNQMKFYLSIFIFCSLFLITISFFIIGLKLIIQKEGKNNVFYKSKRSMANSENTNFANKFLGYYFLISFIALFIIISFIYGFLFNYKNLFFILVGFSFLYFANFILGIFILEMILRSKEKRDY